MSLAVLSASGSSQETEREATSRRTNLSGNNQKDKPLRQQPEGVTSQCETLQLFSRNPISGVRSSPSTTERKNAHELFLHKLFL